MASLEFDILRANYINVVDVRPLLSATKMYPNESSFWQDMIYVIFSEITKKE